VISRCDRPLSCGPEVGNRHRLRPQLVALPGLYELPIAATEPEQAFNHSQGAPQALRPRGRVLPQRFHRPVIAWPRSPVVVADSRNLGTDTHGDRGHRCRSTFEMVGSRCRRDVRLLRLVRSAATLSPVFTTALKAPPRGQAYTTYYPGGLGQSRSALVSRVKVLQLRPVTYGHRPPSSTHLTLVSPASRRFPRRCTEPHLAACGRQCTSFAGHPNPWRCRLRQFKARRGYDLRPYSTRVTVSHLSSVGHRRNGRKRHTRVRARFDVGPPSQVRVRDGGFSKYRRTARPGHGRLCEHGRRPCGVFVAGA